MREAHDAHEQRTGDAFAFRRKELIQLGPPLFEVDFGDTHAGTDEETAVQVLAVWQKLIAGTRGVVRRWREPERRPGPVRPVRLRPNYRAREYGRADFHLARLLVGAALPYVFRNVSPQFALDNVFANARAGRGELRDGKLLCTDWQEVVAS